MSWQHIVDRLQHPVPERYLALTERLRAENPALYWYPCCGTDLSPLVFDVRPGFEGLRIFPVKGREGSVVLWMNDWMTEQPSLFQALEAGNDLYSTLSETLGIFKAELRVVEGSCHANAIAVTPEQENDPLVVPIEIFEVVVSNPRANDRVRRPADGDRYTVIYSNIDSMILSRLVFRDLGLALRIGAVIHPGWGEDVCGPINHYQLVPEALMASAETWGGHPCLLTDDRRHLAHARRFSDTFLQTPWTGVPVRLLRLDEADQGWDEARGADLAGGSPGRGQ